MVTLGWLLLLGTAGISAALIWSNQEVFLASAGTIEFLGYTVEPSAGQVFGAGAIAGAMVILSFALILNGLRRRSRRAFRQTPAPAKATASVPAPPPPAPVKVEEKELAKS
ncbi:hypothetical protein [Catelliglobosispora koreensis]|uniref:hypothetical protein n=1 Tax=Catelliglobosispora koreensis TaxID=129052 RepID=UPI0003690575|nr:hypothetical protein [Catelliglobosispora koreensis]